MTEDFDYRPRSVRINALKPHSLPEKIKIIRRFKNEGHPFSIEVRCGNLENSISFEGMKFIAEIIRQETNDELKHSNFSLRIFIAGDR